MNVNDFLKKRKQEESTNTQTGTGNRSSSFIQGLANERRQNVSERFGTSAYGTGNSKLGWPSTSKINQPQTGKTNTESTKITGKKPGETSRSGQSWKERQERLAGQQMANQMQKESGIVPSTKKETTETEKNTAGVTNIGGLSRYMQKPETTVQELDGPQGTLNRYIQKPEVDNRPEKKQTRVQKPTADHYDAEQIRQYQEQEIGDYKKVLEEQNQLVSSDYKNYQKAQQALKEAAMAYHTKQSGENRLAYTKARNQFDHALEALQMSSKRSTELTDEVNSMVSAYQNQYDDNTRYSGKDYAGMRQYITELADQLDQTGESEKNAETGQNLREQYQEEIDRAEKYSYSLMNKEQLQAEYDRLDEISHSGEAKPIYMTNTGLPVFNQQNLSDENIDRANEKKRLIQKAMNQLEMNDAKAAYESYADGTAEKPTYDLAGQNLIDVFEKIVNGERIAQNAGDTTEIALRDQVERNMKYLPDDAKEVMLQFLGDKDYVSAANYYKAYESTMTANYANTQYSELKDWASQNFGTALGGSIGAGFAGAVTPAGAWIDNTFNAINNKLVDVTGEGEYRFSDVNGDLYRGARTAAALQEGVQTYNATTGKWEDALNLASGALTSSVQNVVQFALFGEASLPFMAMSAAGQSAYQGLKSGLSEEQVAVTSTVSGLIEYMTEKLPLEHLLDKINTIGEGGVVTVKQIAEMVRKQGLEEASEEVVGNIADNLFDMWYNKDNSEFRQYSAQLQREGMSKAEADMEAFGKFFVGDSIEAAAAAYLSTFLLIGGNVVSANLQAAQYGKELKAGELFNGTQYTNDEMSTALLAQQIPNEYEGGKYAAEQLKNQVLEGKQLSNRMLGFAAMTNNQVIADASKYLNQALEMGPETQSFKMAMAMTEQYDVGAKLPSKAFVESLKSQIEADKAAPKATAKTKTAQTTTGETLSHYQTVFVENGVGIKDAKNRTEVMNKLILGQSVSDAELRKLHMSAKLTKQMLYELTGVEIPDGVVKEKDLMQYYRSAREGFEAKIKAEAQERTAQDVQAAAEQQRAFEAEQMRQMDIADRVVEATKSDIDERLQYFMEHGKLKETEKGVENEQTGETVLRGTGGRVDGQSDGSTDAAPEGNAEADTRRTESADRRGDAGVQGEVQPVKGHGKAVSSRDFGLKNATTLKTAREVLQEDETTPMRKFSEDVKNRYGYDVVYTDGDFVQRQDGRDVIVRGLFDQESKRLFVNANYFRLSYDQIGNHEVFHIEVANGDVDLQRMAEAFNEATGNKEILDSLVNQYMEKLALDDYNTALEEVFADMNGKFNGIRSVNVTAYQDIFEQIKAASPKNGEAASFVGESEARTETKAAPEYHAEDAVKAAENTKGGVSASNLADVAKTLGSNGMWSMFNSYDGSMDTAEYAQEFVKVYNAAREGNTVETTLDSNQKNQAEWAGATDAGRYRRGETAQKYSMVGETRDGTEVYETSEEVRNMPYRQRMDLFLNIMQNEYAGRTAKFVANDGEVYYARFDENDISKNIYGDRRSSQRGWRAKINVGADGNIFELVENAQHKGSSAESGKSTAAHRGVTGWEYFVKTVQIDNRVYDVLANVRKKLDGEFVYSIQLNENKNKAPAPPVAPAYNADHTANGYASEWVPTNASENSIRNGSETVKQKNSEVVDSDGKNLSERQQEFFSESKARDPEGRLLALYRGHRRGSTVYSADYRGAIWSTTDKAYAETYGNVDEVYANIKNPYELTVKVGRGSKGYDIDEAISGAKAGNHDGAIITFEYDFNNDPLSYDNWMAQNAPDKPADEVVRFVSVRPGETIGEFMDRAKAGPLEKHVVVWESSQFKSAENLTPTQGKDIRYSQETDEEYRRLAEHPSENRAVLQKMVDEAASEAGYTKKAYHGTDGDFWTFSLRNRGKNGEMLGVGYYFAENEGDATGYARGGGKVLPVYLDIQNPVSTTKLTITPEQWGAFLDYAQAHRDEYIDGVWKGNSIKKDFELRYMNDYDSDTDLISGFINATAGRNSEVAEAYLQMLRDSTGIDGAIQGEDGRQVYVAFTPEQIKSAEPVTRNDSGDVIPLSERFNASKGDMRYSFAAVEDNQVIQKAEQMESDGKTPEEIWRALGIARTMDGKGWRYEIDDSGMRYDRTGDMQRAVSRRWAMEDLEAAKADMKDALTDAQMNDVRKYNSARVRGDEAQMRTLYQQNAEKYGDVFTDYVAALDYAKEFSIQSSDGNTLADYISHPKLFEKYPQLKNVGLSFQSLEVGVNGLYNPETNQIILDASLRSVPESTLIHEIQHAVQNIEGFASGSTPEYWASTEREQDAPEREYLQKFKGLTKEQQNQWTRYQELERVLGELFLKDGKESEYDRYEKQQDALYERLYPEQWFKDMLDAWRNKEDPKNYYHELYRNTAGEIEARDVSNRRNLTAEERRNTMPKAADENTVFVEQRYSIDSDMTEDERYRELRGKTVAVTPEAKYTDEQLASIHTLEQLNAKAKSKAEKVIRPLAESLGILNRSMKTPDVEIEFTFSKNNGLKESIKKQLLYGGTYADFAKALVNLDGILENAVLIEQHKDKYAGTVRENPYLNSVSVLVGIFRDGDSIIPTQIEIKDTSNAGGILYMTVTMTKIEAGVMAGASAQRRTLPYVVPTSEIETGVLGSTMNQNGTSRSLIPISSYNLAEIFANVNPADGHFLKYVPDGFLNDAQKTAKQNAIREDTNRIQSYRQKNSVDTDLIDVWREQNPGQTEVTQEGFNAAQRTLLDRYRNDTVLKTAYDSVGAAKNGSEAQEKTSKARTNTFEKLFSEAEKSMDGLKKEDMTYDVIREKESLEGAAARLAQDFNGEVDDLLKRTDWTGEDLDTAMGALSVFREEAQNSGDYSKVVEMAQKIRENATKGGQFVQAFAKYNRTTPEGLLVRVTDVVEKAKKNGLPDTKANAVMKDLTEMADALESVMDGDVNALIDIIQKQAKIRKTPVSKTTLNNLKKQNFEWLRNAASTQYLQIAEDYVKPSIAKRVSTFQTFAHLLNARTGARNIVSNLAFSAVEAAANDISALPDMALGLLTGKRSVGFDQAIFSKANWEGFMEGYSKVQPEIALDIETAENKKYGTGRRTNKMTGNLLSRAMSHAEKLMGYELNLTDEVTKGSIRAETLRQLQGFVDSGKMTMEEAIQAAEQEMLYRTFQDDTLVGTTLSQLKKLGNLVGFGDSGQKIGKMTVHEFGLGDLLTKYTQVPGALVHRSIEFTPAGYAKAIYALAKAQMNGGIKNMSALQQRNIALAIGRATIGSGLIALFAALTKAGIILNADDEDDPDAKALRAAGGISGTQINVDALGRLIRGESADIQDGDTLLGIEFMQPVNGSMTIGALLNNSDDGQNLAQRWLEAILSGTVQSVNDLSVMNTLQTIQSALEYSQEESALGKAKDVALDLAKSSMSGFIPSPVRQFAQGMDTNYRDAYGSKNPLVQGKEQFMNAIPGLRQKLPTKLTNFGEDKTYGGDTVQRWMNAFFTPGSVRTYQADDAVQELLNLYYASGNEKIIPAKSAPYKIQVGNERYEMNAEERREYQTTMGQTAKLWMEQFFSSEDYAGMTTEERAAQVEKIVKSAEDVAKNQVAETMGVDSAKVFNSDITLETTRLSLAGETGVLPSLPDSKSIGDPDRSGYKYDLTNEQLQQWEDLYNGAYTKAVGDVIQSDTYAGADDAEKADMIREAKETAKDTAKDKFLDALQSVGIRAELDESSDLYEVRKGVTEGTNIEKTVRRLKSDGVSDNSISSAITSTIKDGYLAGDFNEKTANKKLVQYGAAKDENDAYWKIREWEGGEDWKKYDQFYTAVESGKKLNDTISYYTSHGVEEKTLKSQITSYFKPIYVNATAQERQRMKVYLLDAYEALGVSRNKASKNIDKWLK